MGGIINGIETVIFFEKFRFNLLEVITLLPAQG